MGGYRCAFQRLLFILFPTNTDISSNHRRRKWRIRAHVPHSTGTAGTSKLRRRSLDDDGLERTDRSYTGFGPLGLELFTHSYIFDRIGYISLFSMA